MRERSWSRRHACCRALLVFAASLLLGVFAIAPQSALAATPFQVGDVFLTGGGSVREFTPSGNLVQTLPDTTGAGVLCFDPTAGDLIVPGFGLFGPSGNLLPSNWGSITGVGRCVAGGLGDVYASACQNGCFNPPGIISTYDLEGNLLHTFSGLITTALEGLPPIYLAVAPDDCTLYYGTDVSDGASINVCTDTQQSACCGDADLRVLPNGDFIDLTDYTAMLLGPSGNPLHLYEYPDCTECYELGTEALDPDGTSFWISGGPDVVRFDINTGEVLDQWPGTGAIAVYPGAATPPPPPPSGSPGVIGSPGSPGSSGVPVIAAPSPSQISALLSAILVPLGRTAKIKALLSNGGYAFRWSAPSAGRLVISWYEIPAGAHLSRARTPILVATVSRNFAVAKPVKLTIVLTRHGRQLLKSARRMRLTAKGSFVPRGKSATTVLKSFTVTR